MYCLSYKMVKPMVLNYCNKFSSFYIMALFAFKIALTCSYNYRYGRGFIIHNSLVSLLVATYSVPLSMCHIALNCSYQ